jgi:type VI secretion system secreted protein Hcp
MAVNAYLVIDGTPGPSTSKTNAIDVMSFSFGASMSHAIGTGTSGAGGRAGRADLSDLTIMKALDKTSPLLFDHCVTGNILTKVELLYDKPVGDKPTDYFKVELTDALISSIQFSGSNENPMESISFAFKKAALSYDDEKADGTMTGFVTKGFDLLTLKAF